MHSALEITTLPKFSYFYGSVANIQRPVSILYYKPLYHRELQHGLTGVLGMSCPQGAECKSELLSEG